MIKNKFKIILPWVALVLWCVLIFSFSARNAMQSTFDSDKIVLSLIKKINHPLYDEISIIVRKSAHFFLYFVLGLFSYFSMKTIPGVLKPNRPAIVYSFVYAVSDESHQYFVPGRSCSILDILLDTLASLVAIVLFHNIIGYCRYGKKKHDTQDSHPS